MARKHKVREALLVVGEGDCEEAFLKHVRSLYCRNGNGVAVTVRNAHGKGPEHVVDHAIRQAKIYEYKNCVALLDTDILWTDRLKSRARKAKISMIGSIPCFEGLLLEILGTRVPASSADCKKSISDALGIDLTSRQAYAVHFSRSVLDKARKNIEPLHELLSFFEGRSS